MTRFAERSFTVGGHKAPAACGGYWPGPKGACVQCGRPLVAHLFVPTPAWDAFVTRANTETCARLRDEADAMFYGVTK